MGCRRTGAALAVQPQEPCRNAEATVQDVPPESRSGREHDHRGTLGLHAVPLRDQGRQSGDSEARTVCGRDQTGAVGADLRRFRRRSISATAAHIAAKNTCEDCHGKVAERDALYREVNLNMGTCMDCHAGKRASTSCNFCHEPANRRGLSSGCAHVIDLRPRDSWLSCVRVWAIGTTAALRSRTRPAGSCGCRFAHREVLECGSTR